MVRRFIGRWLDDRLLSGPDAELRALLIEQLARQGWRVRETDSVLVICEPVRGVPVSASFLRASRLHPLIEADARATTPIPADMREAPGFGERSGKRTGSNPGTAPRVHSANRYPSDRRGLLSGRTGRAWASCG